MISPFLLRHYNAIMHGNVGIHAFSNEIAISRPISEKLGAEIGDMIQVNSADNTKEYLVVGITQHI